VLAAEAAAEKKAEDIVVLDVVATLVITSYFVVATGRNDRQVRTIADQVEDTLRETAGIKPIGREGEREGRWVLLDFGEVVVHVFQPDEREFYRLEKLWADAPRVALPESVTGPAQQAEGTPA
jgi:ribosome-associated protein